MANSSIFTAFERMWQYTIAALDNKINQIKDDVGAPNPDVIYSATPLVTAQATNFSGVTYTGATEYEVDVPNVDEIFVGMQITVIPTMKSATDRPYIVVNGQRSRIYVNASTTSSYFNGTSVDFIAENKPITLIYMGVVSGETTGWKCLNSVRVNVESMMSTGVTPNGYIATAPGTSNERLVWKSPAVLGKCINEDSILTATSTNGVNYTVDIPYVNYSGLYKGLEITIIPNKTSASTAVTLNANNLGAKDIRLTSASSSGTYTAYGSNFLAAGKPVKLMYNGEIWKTVDINRPVATALSGQVAVKNGGTGRETLTSGYYLVGNGENAVTLKSKSQVLSDIGAVSKTDYNNLLSQFNALVARVEALEAKASAFKFHVSGMGDGEGGGGYMEYTAQVGMTWEQFVASDYNYTRECMDQSNCDGEMRSFEIRGGYVYGFVDDMCADCYAANYDEMYVCIDEGNGEGECHVSPSDVIRADAEYSMNNP